MIPVIYLPQVTEELTKKLEEYMFNKIMISFHKNVDCPTSQDLLAYQNDEINKNTADEIKQHISACDFCGAEAEFYSHCPKVGEEKVSVTEIPSPLFELAEALLKNKHKDLSLLNGLLNEKNNLTLGKA